MVGADDEFNELLLCEAKFWAGLTQNQPLGYLKRLRENKVAGNKALVFICPNARIISLWGEVLRLCDINDVQIDGEASAHCTEVDGIKMAIVSWRAIIDMLMQTLSTEHSPLVGDLQQLRGLCDLIDEDAFLPFTPEDFGVDKARRMMNYSSIVDKLAEKLINNLGASAKGLKATSLRYEYIRYLSLGDYGISVKFSCNHWLNYAETPFWLTLKEIADNKWIFAKEAHKKLQALENKVPKELYVFQPLKELLIPLYAPAYVCESDVVETLYHSVKEVFEQLGISELPVKRDKQ